ncbi:MAG: nitroreductase family protein [Spirochaetaceae bacterium]|jgi:nitroreductase/NAD-dependent dihydropyrimidine dehydrogenase PreA subunit|nr:nitroreductase family protein [Spirochaetaceae bacterium]
MENQYQVIIDKGKCVGCGLCCKDCPHHVLELRDGKAALLSDTCLLCGHCTALCPVAAVTISGYDMSEVKAYDKTGFGIDNDVLLNTIQFRRTIRHYLDKPVERTVIEKIIDAGRWTPTGVNKQKVRYIVVEKSIQLLEAEGLKTFGKLKRLAGVVGKFVKLPFDLSRHKLEPGFFFHGAPVIILIVSKDTVDASLAAMSMELMAEALGLGTLYAGLFTRAVKMNTRIRNKLGLAKKEVVVTGLAIGYSEVKYMRTVPRKKADIAWL